MKRKPWSAPKQFAEAVYQLNRIDGGSHHNSRVVAAIETEKRFKRVTRQEAFAMLDATVQESSCR